MSEQNRYGRTVRDWTKLIAELMRTPDDQLETFADHSSASDDAGAARLRQLRDLLDALGEGMQTAGGDVFWQKMEVAWRVLCTAQGLAAAQGPQALGPQAQRPNHPPPPPAAFAAPAAMPPAAAHSPAAPPAAVNRHAAVPPAAAHPPAAVPPTAVQPSNPGAAPPPPQVAAPQLNETAHMPAIEDSPPRLDSGDFRSNVMYGNPGDDSSVERAGKAAERAGSSDGPWKPHADELAQPFPGQNETLAVDALNLSDEALKEAQATMAAMDWPLSKVAQLGAAVSAERQRGEPSRADICRWFGLPTEASIDLVLKGWSERMAADAQMTQAYNMLLAQLRQGAQRYPAR